MTLKQLEYFCAVHTYGSINRAARTLEVSPPAITTAISRLKDEVGDPIWAEDGEAHELTSVGKLLLDYGEQILSLHGQLHKAIELRDFSTKSKVRFAFTIGDDIPDMLQADFAQQHPEVFIYVEQCHSTRVTNGLRSGYIDVGVTASCFAEPGFSSLPYRTEEFGVLLSAQSPLAQKDVLQPKDLKGQTLLVPLFDAAVEQCASAWCAEHHIDVRFHRFLGGLYSRSTLIYQSNTVEIFPVIDDPPPQGMVFRTLDFPIYMQQSIFWSKKAPLDKERELLIQFLSNYAGTNAGMRI